MMKKRRKHFTLADFGMSEDRFRPSGPIKITSAKKGKEGGFPARRRGNELKDFPAQITKKKREKVIRQGKNREIANGWGGEIRQVQRVP